MKKIIAILFSIFIICFSILFIVEPKKDFSENENRKLASFPKFQISSIIDGEYMENLGKYINDHFPYRDLFVSMKNKFEIEILNKKLVNNIFIAEDGYLIENYENGKNTDKIIKNLNLFRESVNVDVDFMLVPTQISIYSDKLPKYASYGKQVESIKEYYSRLEFNNIDVFKALFENKDKKLFFKYDHHWTMDGAYIAYLEYCKDKGIEPVDLSEYSVEDVKGFKGTIYSKLNYPSNLEGEDLRIYKKDFNLEIEYDGKKSNSLYNMDYASKKDKYSIFLNNINSFVEIENKDFKGLEELVVIKDSYANSIIPFLVNHYKKIYVFDPRSYKKPISEFINEKKIENVLILYNANTIDNDTGINAIY